MSPTTTWRRWWIAAGLLLVLALAPGSWQRQSQSEAGHITRESLAGILFPAASSTVTCAWPAELKDRSPMPLRTHRGCRQLPDGDMEWITEC